VSVLKPKLGIVCLVVMTRGGDDAFSIELFTLFTCLTWLQLGHRSHCICCCCVANCCWFNKLIEDDVSGCENKFCVLVLCAVFVLLLLCCRHW
jgi:hypothetical protein